MKIKSIVWMGIIICLLLLALPASASDYALGIFGNANEDDIINMQDVTYTELIILEYKDETQLADAKYDGEIDILDVTQIELIILGREKELTILDGAGEAVTVNKPVERIVVYYLDSAELIRILDAKNKIVGVTNCIIENENQFPELSKRPFVGKVCPGEPDCEVILELHTDVLLTFYNGAQTENLKKKLPRVAVIFLGIYYSDLSDPEGSQFTDGVRKLGYILDKEDEAEEYVKWRIGWIDEIKSRTEGLSEDEKPRVFAGGRLNPESSTYRAYTKIDTFAQMCTLAGGKNIAEDLPEFVQQGSYYITLDPEWVIEQDPEFIFAHDARTPYGYDMDDITRMKEGSDAFMNRPELANIAAVETGNVCILNGIFRNDAAGGVIGAAYMAKLLHPDLFEDLNPEAIHHEYLQFQHFDYDLDEHGVFIYPPIEIDGGLAGIPDRYKGQI